MKRSPRIRPPAILPILVVALSLGLASPALVAAEYYVAVNGDDANDGSIDHPWRTHRRGFQALRAGVTLYFREGAYDLDSERNNGWGWRFTENGSRDQPITIAGYPGEHAILQAQPDIKDAISVLGEYYIFRNLEIRDSWRDAQIYVYSGGNHALFEDMTFVNAVGSHIRSKPNTDYMEVKNCVFSGDYGQGLDLRGRYCKLHHNVFYASTSARGIGILLKMQAAYNEVYNNIFIGSGEQIGARAYGAITIGGSSAQGIKIPWVNECIHSVAHDNLIYGWPGPGITFWEADTCQAYNNTIITSFWPAFWMCGNATSETETELWHPSRNITIKNNIAVASGPMTQGGLLWMWESGGPDSFVSDYNLWFNEYGGLFSRWRDYGDRTDYSTLDEFRAATGNEANGIFADPLFVHPLNANFHLQATSPAINAWRPEDLQLPFDWPDLDGMRRPAGAGYDIGCYEYGSTPADITPPDPVMIQVAGDHPDDEGGAIDIDWGGYEAPPDFREYRAYRKTEAFTDVSGMTPIAGVTDPQIRRYTDAATTDGTGYYYAVTCVDTTGNENKSVQCIGPVQSHDSNTPAAVTTQAADRPNDDGGAIELDWSSYTPPADFGHYSVYRSTASFADVSDMTAIETVTDASQTTYTDATTTDGADYYYAVTCVDAAGNEDKSVTCVGPAQSRDNNAPGAAAIQAEDHPNDDGGAIDIDWSSYTPPADFGHYSVYRSTASFADVSDMTAIETVIDASAKAYTDTSTVEGTDYYYAVACVDAAGNENTSVTCAGPVRSEDNLAPLESHTFGPGVQLVTMPATPSNASLSMTEIFGTNQIARWDAAAQQYVYLTDAPSDPLFAVRPGAGLWVKFPSETPVSFRGNGLSTDTPFETSIEPQWNLVGNPWGASLPWGSIKGSREGSISDLGWTYDSDSGGYMEVHTISGLNRFLTSVPPYHAFWIKADASADKLIISAPGAQTASAASRGADALPIRWLVPIVVSAGDKRDVCNGIGAADTDVLIDNPPAAPDGVDAYLTPITNPNARMAYELRSATGTQRFNLTVATELPNTDVTVALPDLSQLPKDYRVTLRDLDTGNVRHMRTARAYTYNSGPAGGQRQFAIEVGSAISGALAITGATVVPSRGTGAEIRYNISDAATVTTRIYNVAGRRVAELERGRSVPRGAVASVWDGRSAMGTVTPNGAYVLEIAAAGQDGQRARAVCPFVVSR